MVVHPDNPSDKWESCELNFRNPPEIDPELQQQRNINNALVVGNQDVML